MRYFMIADDGSKYGPADLAILNQWVLEGRVIPASTLQEVATARYVRAETVPGLQFPYPVQAQMAPPQPTYPHAAYPRPGYQPTPYQAHPADRQITTCWVLGALGIFLAACPLTFILPTVGLFLALGARRRGHPNAKSALVLNIVGLVISVSVGILTWLW